MTSKFLRVKCKCGNEQNIFSHTTVQIDCNSCNTKLAEPTGGEAAVSGKIVKNLG